jgi:3-oxoadipate enol-lactonase
MKTGHTPGGIFYRVDGEAGRPFLVFSNSLGTNLRMWDLQAEVFSEHFQVIRYDTRGHGRSTAPLGPYTLAQLGEDVIELLDHLDVKQAHFCGISMGGAIGQWLGVHAEERIARLAIANTAARIGTAEGWRARAAAVRQSGLGGLAASAPQRWFTAAFAERAPIVVSALVDAMGGGNAEGYAACCDALAAADQRDDVRRIALPTLVIAGEEDPVTTVEDARFLYERIPGARLSVLPASHISNIEAASAFNQALSSFLQ